MSLGAASSDHRDEKADWSKVIHWVNGPVSANFKDARQTAYSVSALPGTVPPGNTPPESTVARVRRR